MPYCDCPCKCIYRYALTAECVGCKHKFPRECLAKFHCCCMFEFENTQRFYCAKCFDNRDNSELEKFNLRYLNDFFCDRCWVYAHRRKNLIAKDLAFLQLPNHILNCILIKAFDNS